MKFNKIDKIKDYNKKIIKAKIINAEGSLPRTVGDFMLITENEIYGSIGGGQLEFMVINKAQEFLKNNTKKNVTLNIPLGPGIGQCCGGYAQILLSYHLNGEDSLLDEELYIKDHDNLFIFGAGHIGQALSLKSSDLNFNVHLIDSRKDYLYMNEYKDVNHIFADRPWELIKNLSTQSYFIILTHSHDYDFKIINEILFMKSFKFTGLIGSKTKKNKFSNRLKDNGHDQHLINKIECPVGLDIKHSKEPNEIAISIIAKLIDYRSRTNLQNYKITKKINE